MTSFRQSWLVAALLGASACTAPAPPTPEPADTRTDSGTDAPSAAPTTLAGAWQVAAIDGRALADAASLRFTADDREIWWEPRCAALVRSYRIDGNGVAIGPPLAKGPPPPPGTPPPPVCAIGLPPSLTDAGRALDAATRIEGTAEGSVRLSGGGHSLTLASPSR